jgi:hypothetical protein
MSSRNLLNLVLLVIIAVLVAVVVYKPGKHVTPVVKLTALTQSTITKIEITRSSDAKKVLLEKKGDTWQMLEPYPVPANETQVAKLTELAELQSKAHYPIKPGEDLKPFGLDKPGLTVVFNDTVKLEFGGTEPLNYQRYIRNGETLHLTFDAYFYNLSGNPTQFVVHTLLPGKPTITKLVLPTLSLTAQGHGWQAQPPVKQLSNDQVNELLDNWSNAHAANLLDYKPAAVQQQVQVYLKGQDKPIVFDILHEDHAISLGRADIGLKYQFSEEIGKSLLELPARIDATLPKADASKLDAKPAQPAVKTK